MEFVVESCEQVPTIYVLSSVKDSERLFRLSIRTSFILLITRIGLRFYTHVISRVFMYKNAITLGIGICSANV